MQTKPTAADHATAATAEPLALAFLDAAPSAVPVATLRRRATAAARRAAVAREQHAAVLRLQAEGDTAHHVPSFEEAAASLAFHSLAAESRWLAAQQAEGARRAAARLLFHSARWFAACRAYNEAGATSSLEPAAVVRERTNALRAVRAAQRAFAAWTVGEPE